MKSSLDAKQKLVPLGVPWLVSPSTPYLRLIASEGKTTEVTFVAYFGVADEKPHSDVVFTSVEIVENPYFSSEQLDDESSASRVVKLEFQQGLWVRMYPAYSDREVVNPYLFAPSSSWSDFNPELDDIDTWLLSFKQEWIRTSICPDPGFYEVKNSFWLQEVKLDESRYKHFLVKGHDAYVEILARNWSWKSDGVLKDGKAESAKSNT